ncbi:hypothetical protein COV93_08745 [Candidatus Woesearchaeota archaeon CG11_big_fil_rev_8_21_14_0_20_43_8]|nr:MAG: hypothetical protein COV93_08745 [Candidatus Woesearchaeota archaeon CG11_big_fil_rev_8_21_14_0_20_43_8]
MRFLILNYYCFATIQTRNVEKKRTQGDSTRHLFRKAGPKQYCTIKGSYETRKIKSGPRGTFVLTHAVIVDLVTNHSNPRPTA